MPRGIPRKPKATIKNWSDFHKIYETQVEREDGKFHTSNTEYIAFIDDQLFQGRSGLGDGYDPETIARVVLNDVPISKSYKRCPKDYLVYTRDGESEGKDVYIKRPRFFYDRDGISEGQRDRLLEEAKVLEMLRQHPHPNIANYRGCVLHGKFVVGLAFQHYARRIDQVVKDTTGPADNYEHQDQPPDKLALLQGIRAAVEHLHSLGLAYNAINPANVMVDEHNQPVLTNFAACRPVGEGSFILGLEWWNDGYMHYKSSLENDEIGLKKMCEWLKLPNTSGNDPSSGESDGGWSCTSMATARR
jgi:serine/threonine protein kinase